MPVFINRSIEIVSYWYGRRVAHGKYLHREAPLAVSDGIVKNHGYLKLEGGKIYNDLTIMDLEASGYTITAREKPKCDRYYRLALMLYSVNAKSDLSRRSDAVLVRSSDTNHVEVISGGGYSIHGQRRYDNVIVHAQCAVTPTLFVIQRNNQASRISFGDVFYAVTLDGVEEILFNRENLKRLSELKVPLGVEFWTKL